MRSFRSTTRAQGSDGLGRRKETAYAGRVDETFVGRALFYRRLARWYEADYDLVVDRRASVEAGLAGIRARLP